jgi:N-acetylneuraminic acid mutarotase
MVVYDFGGGTIDIAVVRHDESGFTVIGAGGLQDVGGLDIDATLVEHVGGLLRRTEPAVWQRLQHPATAQDRRDRRLFWEDVRGAKEMLSRTTAAPISVPGVETALHLTRDELEALVEPMLRQTVAETARVVASCRLAPDQLAGIMLVGGSSRVPLVARMLHRSLGVVPTVLEQPELPVAEGAVVHPAELTAGPATGTAAVSVPPQTTYQTQGYPVQQVTGRSGVVYNSQASAPMPVVPVSPVSPVSPAEAPVSAVPVSGMPVSGGPVSGGPVSGGPVSGAPVSGMPVSGVPVSAPPGPMYGGGPAASPVPPSPSPQPSPSPAGRRRLRVLVAAAVVALLLAGGAVWYLNRSPTKPVDPVELAGAWESLAKVPTTYNNAATGIEAAGAAFVDGKLYIIGGLSDAQGRPQLSSVWILDVMTGVWSPGPSLPVAMSHTAVVVDPQRRVHVLGGYTGSGATEKTYFLTPGGEWQEGTPLPEARQAGAAVHDGTTTVYAGGLGKDGRMKDTVWALSSDGRSWTRVGQLQKPRMKLAAATDGTGTAWFIGGDSVDGNGATQAHADIDVVVQRKVTASPLRLPEPRDAPSAVLLEGYGLCVLGGHDGDKVYDWWCEQAGVAERMPKLAVPRAGMAVATGGNTVYVVGGYNTAKKSNGSADAERFTAKEA